jgi:probable HAF family extracellular repeat protein
MRGWSRGIGHLGLGLSIIVFMLPEARADALYMVSDLGPSNPSTNYLNALRAADQAAFQSGSFDGYAHPATVTSLPTFYQSPSGAWDVVVSQDNPNGMTSIRSPIMTASNSIGQEAGTGGEFTQSLPNSLAGQTVLFTPDPHTVTQPPSPAEPNGTSVQSPGYMSIIPNNLSGFGLAFAGSIAGLNDRDAVIINEPTFAGPGNPTNAYLQPSTSNVHNAVTSLGTLGGNSSFASALNNANQVAGWSQIASGDQHAFLYMNGTMQDLNLLISPTSGITLRVCPIR